MELINKNPEIIIVSGKARSGKNTVATIIEKEKNLKTIQIAYADYLKEYAKRISGWDGEEETKPRDLLQTLGVELIKTHIDEAMLVKRIIEDIKVYAFFFELIIITDARFENEINSIKREFKNAISIRVNKVDNNLTKKQQNHKTETALDEFNDYDFIIENNSGLEELERKVKEVLE